MSLINEALKKAQRSRTVGADASLPPMPGGGRIAKLGRAQSANTMVLLGSGAVVLVVLSVVATVFFVNRPAPKPPAAVAVTKPGLVAPGAASPSATVKPILPAEPVAATATPPAPPPAASTPVAPAAASGTPPASPAPSQPLAAPVVPITTAAANPTTTPTATPALPVTPTAPSTPSAPATPPRPDERVATYIESIRIAGVRAQGADSRVLINERVYRLNDIIERTLGIRLIKVDSSSLTFADPNGGTYTKYL